MISLLINSLHKEANSTSSLNLNGVDQQCPFFQKMHFIWFFFIPITSNTRCSSTDSYTRI